MRSYEAVQAGTSTERVVSSCERGREKEQKEHHERKE